MHLGRSGIALGGGHSYWSSLVACTLWVGACGGLSDTPAWSQAATDASSVQPSWELGPTGSHASLRGLIAATDQELWMCGGEGTVLRSTDAGSSWTECGPPAFSELEFRSIHAWDARTACIVSAGSPAVILKTEDSGTTWREVFRHPSSMAFFNGLKFWDAEHGIVFGDPLEGHWCLLQTADGGEHWLTLEPPALPAALAQEAAFAASNSAMCLGPAGAAWIGTGGTPSQTSRVLRRAHWTAPWTSTPCPLVSSATEGIFSLCHSPTNSTPLTGIHHRPSMFVAVGGDYRDDQTSHSTAAYSEDEGQTWRASPQAPASYCSAVAYLKTEQSERELHLWIATGPKGSYTSADGRHWQRFSDRGFHTLAASSNALFAAGADGRFAKLRF